MITADLLDAVKVQFIKPIFEEDFVERGMTAWLTAVEYNDNSNCYKLYFDFAEFEAMNEKYFKETYYKNNSTCALGLTKDLYTAKEAGMYTTKLCTYFGVSSDTRDDELFSKEIGLFLKAV